MKKIVFLAFVLVLLSTAVVAESISPVVSYPTEIEVLMEVDLRVHNIDSGKNFSTIQEAIDDNETLNGHTIFVEEGHYYENVVVHKDLLLIGENRSNTIIDGNYTGNVVKLISAGNITGFTIQNSGFGQSGVELPTGGFGLNNISNNIIINNYHGVGSLPIHVETGNNIISGNIVCNNTYGIDLGTLHASNINDTICGNTILNNSYGIYLDFSRDNTLFNNTILNNTYGIYFDYSDDNMVFHNNFVDNTQQTYSRISTNFWDNDIEGNYWSNYTGVDSNQDGIGDSPHVLDGNNTDYYPLMGMFHSFIASPGYNVNVISNSTIEDFQYFEANSTIKMDISNMTANQTFGFCRVCIPHALMHPNNIWVVIDGGQTEVLFANFTLYDNTTHRWIYFAYPHSTHEVIMGEDNTPPLIENVHQQPAEDNVSPDDKVEVYANVTDNLSGVKQVILNYTTNNGTWFSEEMTNLKGNLYNATIPEFPYCTNVTYKIIAGDNANNTITTEEMGYEYQYHVIPEFPTWTSMLLVFTLLTVAIAIYKRRLLKTPIA